MSAATFEEVTRRRRKGAEICEELKVMEDKMYGDELGGCAWVGLPPRWDRGDCSWAEVGTDLFWRQGCGQATFNLQSLDVSNTVSLVQRHPACFARSRAQVRSQRQMLLVMPCDAVR